MEYSSLNDKSENLNKIKSQVIIVSCYFKVKSKNSHEFYLKHMSRFLKNIPHRVIFFTTPDMNDFIINQRGNLDIDIINVESVYDIKAFKKKSMDFWTEQIKLSPHNIHSPELIAIWFNKKEFVKEAIEYFSKKYSDLQVDNNNLSLSHKNELSNQNIPFIWCDAGSIRSDQWLTQIKFFGNNLKLLQKDKLNMQLLNVNNQNKYFFEYGDVFIAGAIIAGYKKAWEECSELYDNMIEEYSNKKITCEMDQYIWMSCAQKNPEKFNLILFKEYFNSYDKWFFFYSIL